MVGGWDSGSGSPSPRVWIDDPFGSVRSSSDRSSDLSQSMISPDASSPTSPPLTRTSPQGNAFKSGVGERVVASLEVKGVPGTPDYFLTFLDSEGTPLSPWHDISLCSPTGNFRAVCKTPRGRWAEYEYGQAQASESDGAGEDRGPTMGSARHGDEDECVEKDSRSAGACRESKTDGLRHRCVRGRPTHFAENAVWNVCMLPQTWADPANSNPEYGGLPYDGRPVEVIEIGSRTSHTGEVYEVKPLAAFATIRLDGSLVQLSWKVVAIRADDLGAFALDDVSHVARRMPGALEEIREWLRRCHCVDPGDQSCVFGLNERAAGAEEARRVVQEAHASWQTLIDHNPQAIPSDLPAGGFREGKFSGSPDFQRSPSRSASKCSSPLTACPSLNVDEDGESLDLSSPLSFISKFSIVDSRKISLSDPNGKARRCYDQARADSSSNDSGHSQGADTVSTPTTKLSISGTGSLSRRQSQKTLRSSPMFARPAYIEPRGENNDTTFDEVFEDEEFPRRSILCFAAMGGGKPSRKLMGGVKSIGLPVTPRFDTTTPRGSQVRLTSRLSS